MRLLTIPDVAEVLRVRPPRAYELVREGVLPAVRIGRQIRVSEDILRAWIARGGQPLTDRVTNVDPVEITVLEEAAESG